MRSATNILVLSIPDKMLLDLESLYFYFKKLKKDLFKAFGLLLKDDILYALIIFDKILKILQIFEPVLYLLGFLPAETYSKTEKLPQKQLNFFKLICWDFSTLCFFNCNILISFKVSHFLTKEELIIQ